jgi:hypothetical protein
MCPRNTDNQNMTDHKHEQTRFAARVDVGLTAALDERLKAESRRLGESKSAIVRLALREYFQRRPLPAPARPASRGEGTGHRV